MTNSHTSFFFSDIVGYSKMVEHDESMAHRMLKEHNKIIEESVLSNDGRVVKYIGDSVFAEFNTPDSACAAALAIQCSLQERNSLTSFSSHCNILLHSILCEICQPSVISADDYENNYLYPCGINNWTSNRSSSPGSGSLFCGDQ